MAPFLWVAAGSALGGVARYGFGLIAVRLWGESFPWGTIAINVLGSFIIGFFATLTLPEGAMPASANLRTFVMVGICGGFTTFSSFSLQTLTLARDGNWFATMGNIVLSVVLCLLAVTAGHVSAERIGMARTEAGRMPFSILALLDRTETALPVLTAAALAARRMGGGRIEAMHVRHDAMEGFMPTEDVMTEHRRQEIEGHAAQQSAALRAVFDAWRPAGGLSVWRELTGETGRLIAGESARADLVVIGRPATGPARQALHTVLFETRRLTLVVPDTQPAVLGQHVAVAWKPSAAADAVLLAGLPLLTHAGRVTVLIGTDEGGPAAEPTGFLRRMADAKVAAEVRRFDQGSRGIGEAILAEARLIDADLLAMGAFTHNRFVEMLLGGATREILAAAHLPVLMHH